MSEFLEYAKANQHSGNCTRAEAFTMGQRSRQSEIDQLTEMNQRYKGKMQEQQDQIAELKDHLATYKIESYESNGRLSYAHHFFTTMDRDYFCKNIEAIICGRLRHPDFSFDRTRIKTLRDECD